MAAPIPREEPVTIATLDDSFSWWSVSLLSTTFGDEALLDSRLVPISVVQK